MSSLVLDLEQEVMEPECDILSALRKAHLIASKLKLTEFDTWIMSELNGYTNCDDIPDYRKVKGQLKAWNPCRGWIPVEFQDTKTQNQFCCTKLKNSISDILWLYNQSDRYFFMNYDADKAQLMDKMCNIPFSTQYSLAVSTHYFKSIIEQVKNCLLEWIIELETEGILGENMRFSQEETIMAKDVPQQINNYYGNVVIGDVKKSQLVSGDNNTLLFHPDQAQDLIRQIREAVEKEQLSKEDRESAHELIDEVETKIAEKKNPAIIKAALTGLKDFFICTGANIAGALITQYLQQLS